MTMKQTLLLGVIFFVANSAHSQEKCGFVDLEENTPENPLIVPAVSDNLEDDFLTTIWQHNFKGNVAFTSVDPHPHEKYATGSYAPEYHRIRPNSFTKSFTRDFQTRTMKRAVVIVCADDRISRYHLEIPFQDMTPPQFQEPLYTLDITPEWNLTVPISFGTDIIVSDNAFEIEKNPEFLQFQTDGLDDIIEIKGMLMGNTDPGKFDVRLDVYLKAKLTAGASLQVLLSAMDEFNKGTTTVEINVK